MKNILLLEYCTGWGYIGRAVALTRSILNEQKNNISELTLIPSSGGVFEVTLNDELLFSKKELDRFPEKDEVEDIVRDKLA